jgi:hypothetical protein
MGSMTSPASDSLKDIVARLDQRIQKVDEERWLSSRYAAASDRDSLIILYAFYYELARVRVAVTDVTLGQIRFQWWRDALAELARGEVRQHDVVLALRGQIEAGRLNLASLNAIVDRYEAAYLSHDRATEPDDLLVSAAMQVIDATADATPDIKRLAAQWAALRRRDSVAETIKSIRMPGPVRPALGHFRLARSWAAGKVPGRVARRLLILGAMLTGRT